MSDHLWQCEQCTFETDRDSFRIVHEEMNGHDMWLVPVPVRVSLETP